LVERRLYTANVGGSSPSGCTKFLAVVQWIEQGTPNA
jgi:hypothetical protein